MATLNHFEERERESSCYIYCIDTVFDLVEKREYAKAAAYYENAARSLRVLQELKGEAFCDWAREKVVAYE